jgi:hypothetical protein
VDAWKAIIILTVTGFAMLSALHLLDGRKIKRMHNDRPDSASDGGDEGHQGDAR